MLKELFATAKIKTDKFSMYRNQFDEINDAYYFIKEMLI